MGLSRVFSVSGSLGVHREDLVDVLDCGHAVPDVVELLPAEKEGGDWMISVPGLKERFPRMGATFWYEVALDYYHSRAIALEAKAETVRASGGMSEP